MLIKIIYNLENNLGLQILYSKYPENSHIVYNKLYYDISNQEKIEFMSILLCKEEKEKQLS